MHKFKLKGISYLEGAGVVSVMIAAEDKNGKEHLSGHDFKADEAEVQALLQKAVIACGGDVLFAIAKAEEVVEPTRETTEVVVPSTDPAVKDSVNARLSELKEQERLEKKRLADEARAAEEALRREDNT